MARQPGMLGDQRPKGDDWVAKEFADMRAQITELRASISALTGFTFVDGKILSRTFDGDLDAPSAGTEGIAFGGPHDTAVLNDLVLRGQIIGNDALTNPITAAVANGTTSGITLPTTDTTLRAQTIAVPEGFTQAFVIAVIQVGGVNPTANLVGVHATARVDGVDSDDTSTQFPQNQGAHAVATLAILRTGLSGSFTVSAVGHCSSGGFTNATARIAALAIFGR